MSPPVPTRGPGGWMEPVTSQASQPRPVAGVTARIGCEHQEGVSYAPVHSVPKLEHWAMTGGFMNELRILVGHLVGRLGILVCLLVVPVRLLDLYSLFGFSTSDLLGIGIACLLIGCFELLLVHTKSH